MDTLQNWHLMKHDDGSVFGPVTFSQIKDWACAAQISPLDKVSNDGVTWIKAPMYPELEMDWLLQVTDDHYYGPTTLPAMQEFIRMGDIDENTIVINCKDATQTRAADLEFLTAEAVEDASADPDDTEIDRLNKRVKRLEDAIIEDRRLIRQLESRLAGFLDSTDIDSF